VPPTHSAAAATAASAGRRITAPPSMAQLAADALRAMILSGELLPGDRVIENRLTTDLGVSRPPLREAMRVLEQEGLIMTSPRRGAIVSPLTLHDVYEIYTLRAQLERLAVDLGVPVRSPGRLQRCRAALAALEDAAEDEGAAEVTALGFGFHLAVVGLAGHRRIEEIYRSLSLQMRLCMGMNRRVRKRHESLPADAARHRRILERVEAGDVAGVHRALAAHGHRTFLLELGRELEGHSPESEAWLAQLHREQEAHESAEDAPADAGRTTRRRSRTST
jgi:DNA-binding GntR family transcriptional regulator